VVVLPYIEATGIRKRFGGVVALDGANFACERGEVHALLGANGSGKSTLAKVFTGIVAPDAGEIRVEGRTITVRGPADMYRLGIAAVYQELSLVPQLSVTENIMLGHEVESRGLVHESKCWEVAAGLLSDFAARLGRQLSLHIPVMDLSPADQQIVEIVKALSREPKVLILDEATASLRSREVEVLFELVRRLREGGCAIIFISHRMEEVMQICDRATVLRNGKVAATVRIGDTTPQELVKFMVGDVDTVGRQVKARVDAPVALRVNHLWSGRAIKDVTLEVRQGEVVGLGGLQGQGQSELLKAVFGAYPIEAGQIEIDGRQVAVRRPADAIQLGIVLVPGNRAREGLCLPRSVFENVTLPSLPKRSWHGLLSPRVERAAATGVIDRLEVRLGSMFQPASSLSGGNQQKIVIGKWLLSEARVLLMDDATKGVDVRTRHELYRFIRNLCDRGACVLMNSSDNAELVTVCDRILIMYEGEIVEELSGSSLTEETLVAASLRVEAGAERAGGFVREGKVHGEPHPHGDRQR